MIIDTKIRLLAVLFAPGYMCFLAFSELFILLSTGVTQMKGTEINYWNPLQEGERERRENNPFKKLMFLQK